MSTPRHSNKFLDNMVNDAIDAADCSVAMLERLLTDRSEGSSSNGVNPNSRDVLNQVTGCTVDRIQALFKRVQALKDVTAPDLEEVRRIRTAQSPRTR